VDPARWRVRKDPPYNSRFMPVRDVVILSAARTPIGRYGGSFKDLHPAELGAVAARAAITRAGIAAADVDEVLVGHGRQAGSGPNPGRQVGHRAGVPDRAPAQTINKACASSLQAIVSGAQSIMLGESDVVLAGGIESMSRMPYLIDAIDARWGHRMGNFTLVDAMYRDGFQCPISNLIMGETAEILGRQHGITREQSDAFALESQRKAKAAIDAGHFAREIAPVTQAGPNDTRRLRACASCRRCSARLRGSPGSSPPAPRPASPTAARR
jgi:acetyl-CoA C-acetyltransferase